MVGRCKEMMAEEAQKYFQGKEMYEVKPDLVSKPVKNSKVHRPRTSKTAK